MDIAAAVEDVVPKGYGIVESLVGHGVGFPTTGRYFKTLWIPFLR